MFVQENPKLQNMGDILIADVVYILMKKTCYVSRSMRMQWFLQNLNNNIRITKTNILENEGDIETLVVAVLPKNPPSHWNHSNSFDFEYNVTLGTNVIFLGETHRFVICLDISPSVSTVDIQLGQVLIDVIKEALEKLIRAIIKPFVIPDSSLQFNAEMYITVIAHTPFYISPAQQVLVQGWKISEKNVNEFLESVLDRLNLVEDEVALVSGSVHGQVEHGRRDSQFSDPPQGLNEVLDDLHNETNMSVNISMVTPGSAFLNILRYGMLALKLLPTSNFSSLIVITDGIIAVPDGDILDSVLNHMRYNDIACNFLHVGSQFHPHCGFGYTPYPEIMQLLSVATNGHYSQFLPQNKLISNTSVNSYQQNFLTWSLKRNSVINELSTLPPREGEWRSINRHFRGNRGSQLMSSKYQENDVSVSLFGIIACRIREGFILEEMEQKENELVIKFVLPWTNHIYVDYTVSCPWPINTSISNYIHYITSVRGPFEFLHDISCKTRPPIKSPFRNGLITRFWKSLKSFTQSDSFLSHLESFVSNTNTYKLPKTLKNGMPLYVLNQECSPIINSSDPGYIQFGNIWKPLCLLNANLWQKWFHTDRVCIIFRHDNDLHLFDENFVPQPVQSTGLQCRQSTYNLFSFLQSYSSFVLIENHSYIKFLNPTETGTGKYSYMIIRSIVKPPCAVLHIAFLYNIPGYIRSKLVADFKNSIGNVKVGKRIKFEIQRSLFSRGSSDNVLQNSFGMQVNACIILEKPLEKILIRYEQMPKNFRTIIFPDGTQPRVKSQGESTQERGLITTLSRYLHHRRWIWETNVDLYVFLPLKSLENVFSALIEKRLEEGFYFVHYGAGICNMVLEVPMMKKTSDDKNLNISICQSCVIQYVIFAPKLMTCDNVSDKNITNSNVKVIEFVTECWIEPVNGVTHCENNKFFSDLQYHQLPDAIWSSDANCISSLFTYELLKLMCANPNIVPPESIQHLLSNKFEGSYWPNVAPFKDQRINAIPLAYSLPNLLNQCHGQSAQFNLFSMDILDKRECSTSSNKILLNEFHQYLRSVYQKELVISGHDAQKLIQNIVENHKIRERPNNVFGTQCDGSNVILWAKRNEDKNSYASQYDTSTLTSTSFDTVVSPTFLDLNDTMVKDLDEAFKFKCFVKFDEDLAGASKCFLTILPESLDIIKRTVLGPKEDGGVLNGFYQGGSEMNPEWSASVMARINSCSFNSSAKDFSSYESDSRGTATTYRLRASTWDPEQKAKAIDESNADSARLRTHSMGTKPLLRSQLKRSSFEMDSTECLPENVIQVKKFVPLSMPIFICSCSTNDVVELLNFDEDLKMKLYDDVISEDEGEDNTVTSLLGKDEENNDEYSLNNQFNLIESAFRKFYVQSLFKYLRAGYEISVQDVNQAFTQCENYSITIELTDYMKNVCNHLKNNLSKNESIASTCFTCSSSCYDLRFVHKLIKKKFFSILHSAFKVIPSKLDHYFYFPSSVGSKPSTDGLPSLGLLDNSVTPISVESILPTHSSKDIRSTGTSFWENYEKSVDSEDHRVYSSLLTNVDSNSTKDGSMKSSSDDSNPFFLGIRCQITAEDNLIHRCSLTAVPTCICDIFKSLNEPIKIKIDAMKINLELVCLTTSYPEIKKGTVDDFDDSHLKNVDYLLEDVSKSTTINETSIEDNTFCDGKIPKPLECLSYYQYDALRSCITQLKWMIKDEIVTFMLDNIPTTSDTLKAVCEHIESDPNAASCYIEKVPLTFVFNEETESFNKFVKDFDETLKIPFYRLKKLDNMYYLVKNTDEKPADNIENVGVTAEDNHIFQTFSSSESSIFATENDHVSEDLLFAPKRFNSVSGCDEENSKIVSLILNRESGNPELPNFWLIATISTNFVTVYFHCRFLKINGLEVQNCIIPRENVIENIKNLCKMVNQNMLLNKLHDTLNCDLLLEPESPNDEDYFRETTTVQNTNPFSPGYFACPLVWETKFILHPRLKAGKSNSTTKITVSKGIQALSSALVGLSVNNRKNLFVYQDKNKNVHYMRLYESVHKCNKLDVDECSCGSYSRSSSFTSLSKKQFDEQSSLILTIDDPKSRNKSVGDDLQVPKCENFIILKVFGIVDAGNELKIDLVQALQNKLDDAVLDVISSNLSRNTRCKLLSEDVHFIQKPNEIPSWMLQFAIHDIFLNNSTTLKYLLRRNIEYIATKPRYSDPRPCFHFQDYSVPQDSLKHINDGDIFLYNQSQTHTSGTCGNAIACIALAIVNKEGDLFEPEKHSDYSNEILNAVPVLLELKNYTSTTILESHANNENEITVEFRIWKQGKVNLDMLKTKLTSVVRHSLWELLNEKYILPLPIICSETGNLNVYYHTIFPEWNDFALELKVSSVKKKEFYVPLRSNLHFILRELNFMFPSPEMVCHVFYKSENTEIFIPCLSFENIMHHTGDECMMIIRSNETLRYSAIKLSESRSESRLQGSSLINCEENIGNMKKKVIIISFKNSKMKIAMHNLNKDKMEFLCKTISDISEWLIARSSLLTSIIEQKMGIFFNLPIERDDFTKTWDSDTSLGTLLQYPPLQKQHSSTKLSTLTDVFRNVNLLEQACIKNSDDTLFELNMKDLQDAIKHDNRKHNFYNENKLDQFLRYGRIIHFCLTPLLFSPRWRLETSATEQPNIPKKLTPGMRILWKLDSEEESWHKSIRIDFVQEYKRYLVSLGFNMIQTSTEKYTVSTKNSKSSVHYFQKKIFGGVLLFEIYFTQPFFGTKLYAIEYERMKEKSYSLPSQFTYNFLDECDRSKLQMHLHSFTYDYHLRSLYQFLTKKFSFIPDNYSVINFLRDFIKYYPKAPNFARSLVSSDSLIIQEISIPQSQLLEFLLKHCENYDIDKFVRSENSSDFVQECENFLIKVKSSSSIQYRDTDDGNYTGKFDVVIIISTRHCSTHAANLNVHGSMQFQIYVMITSHQELYPKEENEKIGKFRTVSMTILDDDFSEEEYEDESTEIHIQANLSSSVDSTPKEFEKDDIKKKRSPRIPMRSESINYMGYYSSHEEAMQRAMLIEMDEAKRCIKLMVKKGEFDCKSQVLWNKLLSLKPKSLSYPELQQLLKIADVREISNNDENLKKILRQPANRLIEFINIITSKFGSRCQLLSDTNRDSKELLILHPDFKDGFILFVVHLQSNYSTMSIVYRLDNSTRDSNEELLSDLFNKIVNNMCFQLYRDVL